MADIKFPTHEMMLRQLASDSFWKVIVYTYDESDNLIYTACNRIHSAETDAETWYIWKATWDGSNRIMVEGPLIGSVDGQESLAWRS